MWQAGLLLLAWPVAAQVRLGETSTSLNGTVSSGYTADYGNMSSSDHGWVVGGVGNFSGSFHNPNFLSYNGTFYLNQSSANSGFQSISDTSGFSLSTNLFNGSRFPGSISYSKAYDSQGNYSVPGLANFVTHGNNDALNVSWTEALPSVPSLTASYLLGDGSYSVYGTSEGGNNHFHSLNLHSSYALDGFNMGAFYELGGSHALIPEVASGVTNLTTQTSNSNLGFNVSHRLPLRGSASTTYTRSTWSSDFLNAHSNGTIDLVNALAAVHPTDRFSLSLSADYSDNVSGQLDEALLGSGVAAPVLNSNQSSDSIDVMFVGSYTPAPNVQTAAQVEHRSQSFLGVNYGVTSYGGGGTWAHSLLGGSFNSSVNLMGNIDDRTGDNSLSFSTTENYSGVVSGWHVNGLFSYAQNVQTLLVSYMNSFYSFSGNVRRRWGQFNLNLGAGASRTGLTDQPGTESNGQTYTAGMGYGAMLMATGTYSKSSGQALVTGSGLVTIPIPQPVLPSGLTSLYGGDAYAFSLASTPVRGLVLSGSWSKALSNTTTATSTTPMISANQSSQFNSYLQWQFRKLYFNSGYARLEQGFTAAGNQPQIINSYYMGISRWFNFF